MIKEVIKWVMIILLFLIGFFTFVYITTQEIMASIEKEETCENFGGERVLNDGNKCYKDGELYSIIRLKNGHKIIKEAMMK